MTAAVAVRSKTEIDLLYKEMEDTAWFADYLQQPHLELNEINVFAAVVRNAVEKHGLEIDALCERFGVSYTTISRWKGGKNAPQPFARPVVVKWIEDKMRCRVKKMKESLGSS